VILLAYGGLKKAEWMRFYRLRFIKNYSARGEVRVRTGSHDPAAKFGRGYARRVQGWLVECSLPVLRDLREMEAPQYRLTKIGQDMGTDIYAFQSTAGPKEFESWPLLRGELE
jgi:hypothetical protein